MARAVAGRYLDFGRDIRPVPAYTFLASIGFGGFTLIFNFHVYTLDYREDAIGLALSAWAPAITVLSAYFGGGIAILFTITLPYLRQIGLICAAGGIVAVIIGLTAPLMSRQFGSLSAVFMIRGECALLRLRPAMTPLGRAGTLLSSLSSRARPSGDRVDRAGRCRSCRWLAARHDRRGGSRSGGCRRFAKWLR